VSGAQRLAESAHATKGPRGSAQLLEARAARLARFVWFGALALLRWAQIGRGDGAK
jgi:hypothetical protein